MTPDAATLYDTALRLTNDRRYADAEIALDAALAAASDLDLRVRIAGTRAYVVNQLGHPADAERICREAWEIPGLSAHTRGVLAGQLGSLFMHNGQLEDADRWLGEAIDTIPGDPLAVANLRMNRSIVAMQRHDLTASSADVEAAIEAYRAHAGPVEVAEAQHNLGYIALLGGDLVRAMREMAAARPAIAAVSEANTAIGDVDAAEALRDAGLVTEAERLLQTAARVFGSNRMPQARAEAEFQLARSLLRHDPAASIRAARTAARHFAALGAHAWEARAHGIRLRAALSSGAIDRAGREVRSFPIDEAEVAPVARRLDAAGFGNDAAALRLALEWWRARHGRKAGRMPTLPATPTLEVRLLVDEVRAERAVRARRESEARKAAASGLDELSSWRSSFGSLDMQTSLAMHGTGLMLAGLGSAVRSGRPDIVFEWAERARHLSLQVVPLRPPADPEQAADLSELRMLRADAAGADWTNDPRAADLAARLRHRQWTTTGAADLERAVGLGDAHAALDADTVLLSYVFSPEGLACLVVTAGDARVVPLPGWREARVDLPGLRSDLDMAAAVRVGPMVDVVRRSLAERLERLSGVLLAEPMRGVDARRVVVTAPGVLSGLPWAMLPRLRGRAVTVAASASRWVHGRPAQATAQARSAVFAVGPRVRRGREEAEAGAAAWERADVRTGDAASVDAVIDAAGTADVLHVSAHGRHSLDNPLFSGVQLADGVLFGYDIDRMPQVPPTVVLSSCETGRSAVRWGEESVGMARAWLHAGAQCVIAAPVVVADDDACELMGALHVGLSAGRTPADALAEAAATTGVVTAFQCHGNGF